MAVNDLTLGYGGRSTLGVVQFFSSEFIRVRLSRIPDSDILFMLGEGMTVSQMAAKVGVPSLAIHRRIMTIDTSDVEEAQGVHYDSLLDISANMILAAEKPQESMAAEKYGKHVKWMAERKAAKQFAPKAAIKAEISGAGLNILWQMEKPQIGSDQEKVVSVVMDEKSDQAEDAEWSQMPDE